eukprot:3854553-Pyramimonas_sp.AAC.1
MIVPTVSHGSGGGATPSRRPAWSLGTPDRTKSSCRPARRGRKSGFGTGSSRRLRDQRGRQREKFQGTRLLQREWS